MNNNNGIYRYKNIVKIIILIVIYLMLNMFIGLVNGLVARNFGPISVAGVFTGIMFILATAMTILNYDFGGTAAIILLSIGILSAGSAILRTGDISPIQGVFYNIGGLIAICLMKKYLSNIVRISYTDEITGLRNRRSIWEYISNLFREKKKFYVMYMDLNNFSYVNDIGGHEGGDILLKQIANRWRDVDCEGGVLGRIGGDEFVCVVPFKEGLDIEAVAQRYIDKIQYWSAEEVTNEAESEEMDRVLLMSVNIGISACPEDAKTVNEIVQFADLAMYDARKNGSNTYSRYRASLNDTVVRERMIEKLIKKALDEEHFYMVYQPQFYTKTKKLRGFEALIRMNPSVGENIGPATFIPIADKSDLIIDIGEFVMKRAMTEICKLAKEKGVTLSVNISPRQIIDKSFVPVLRGVLQDTQFPPEQLEIEITEYCLMDDTAEVLSTIGKIKEMGIRIAMDDFGTGYSSLSYLTKLPIDIIKIDKSIIDNINEGEIVKAIITMGHALKCEIISEGVEVEQQVEVLKNIDNDIVQGYIWGGPMKVEEIYNMYL